MQQQNKVAALFQAVQSRLMTSLRICGAVMREVYDDYDV